MWSAIYDRDTRRYPSDYYEEQPFVVVTTKKALLQDDDPPFPDRGAICVFTRRRFSRDEIKRIWIQSNRKCYMCKKKWKLAERSRTGWHIDHLIPNIGGGKETEMMENFRVACARCNLGKGRGYTSTVIRGALHNLLSSQLHSVVE
jgi:hypothetical protein